MQSRSSCGTEQIELQFSYGAIEPQQRHHESQSSKRSNAAIVVSSGIAVITIGVLMVVALKGNAFSAGGGVSTATVLTAKTSPQWAIALSGGGWRAQAACVGFMKAVHEAGLLPQIDTISSVSGGSWCSTQYAFSERFYHAVNTQQPWEMYANWLQEYYKAVPEYTSPGGIVGIVASYNKDVSEMLDVTGATNYNWQDFVSLMLDSFTANISDLAVDRKSRQGQRYTDLMISTTLAVQGQLRSGAWDVLEIDGKRPQHMVVPFSFAVAGDHKATDDSGWYSPRYPIGNMTVKNEAEYLWDASLGQAPLALDLPTLGKAAAMSSAAAGILAAPQLLRYVIEEKAGDVAGYAAFEGLINLNLQSLAVCTGPRPSSGCAFPSLRLLDGGYSDNSGVALLIGKMQKEHGVGTPLRLALLNSDGCVEGVASKLCQDAAAGNWGDLFGVQSWKPGFMDFEGIYVPSVNSQVFATPSPGSLFATPLNITNGTHPMTYTALTATTIDAPEWGVKEGTTVELFNFQINSPISMITTPHDKQNAPQFADLAQDVYDILQSTGLLKDFFTDGVVPRTPNSAIDGVHRGVWDITNLEKNADSGNPCPPILLNVLTVFFVIWYPKLWKP